MSALVPDHDTLIRFLLDDSGVRGVLVRLDRTWQTIAAQADYPDAVRDLLGQAAAAAALFTGHTKVEGRLSVQLNAHGPVKRLFAECTQSGTLRGLAHWEAPLPDPLHLDALGDDRLLAITIESAAVGSREPMRYQGLVPLQGESLSIAFEHYFASSEQIPTRLLLAADGSRATGLMLQRLPGTEVDDSHWDTTQALFETLGAQELLDTAPDTLLHRLFHEGGVRVLAAQALSFGCSCSRERVAAVLRTLGREEALAAAAETGVAEIRCEFCGQRHDVDRVDIERLFSAAAQDSGPALH